MSYWAVISCDYYNWDAPEYADKFCSATVHHVSLPKTRKEAREKGWALGVGKSRMLPGKDFCPKHKPSDHPDTTAAVQGAAGEDQQ